MTNFRSETRHPSGVRVIDRVPPESDPYAIPPGGRIPSTPPDPTRVPALNRRFVVQADGEITFVGKTLNEAVGTARRANLATNSDAHTVQVVDIDDRDQNGEHVWREVREWAAAQGDDLTGPALARPKPEEMPETKEALRVTRQLEQDTRWDGHTDFRFFVERSASMTFPDGSLTQKVKIISASRSRSEAVLQAHRLNQKAGQDELFHVRRVNVATDAYIDALGHVEHGPYRQFVQALREREQADVRPAESVGVLV